MQTWFREGTRSCHKWHPAPQSGTFRWNTMKWIIPSAKLLTLLLFRAQYLQGSSHFDGITEILVSASQSTICITLGHCIWYNSTKYYAVAAWEQATGNMLVSTGDHQPCLLLSYRCASDATRNENSLQRDAKETQATQSKYWRPFACITKQAIPKLNWMKAILAPTWPFGQQMLSTF